MPRIIGIIPARMASTRFPGKPMAKICGIPMIGHVYLRSRMSDVLDEVYVATCDKEIADYIKSIGGKAVMTKTTHERASDRAAEALLKVEKASGQKVDVVVMIQGDEPMVFPEMMKEALKPMLEDKSIQIVNLTATIKSEEDRNSPHVVKVVMDTHDFALYFSREPIPSRKKARDEAVPTYKQVPIIPFKRDFLIRFNELSLTPLEIIESVDMLRLLEHGYKVKMAVTQFDTFGVDIPEDLEKVEGLMKTDRLIPEYGIKDKNRAYFNGAGQK